MCRKHLTLSGMLYLYQRQIILIIDAIFGWNLLILGSPILLFLSCTNASLSLLSWQMSRWSIFFSATRSDLYRKDEPFYVHRVKSRLYFTWMFGKYGVPRRKMFSQVRSVVEQFLRKCFFEHHNFSLFKYRVSHYLPTMSS